MQAITRRYAALGFRPYVWFEAQSPPALQALAKPVRDSRLGVLTTAGTYVAGQVAYHYKDDTSVRTIPKDTPTDRLRFAHITENYLEDPRRDPGCIFPVEALRAAEADAEIGEVAPELLSCMGGIYSQRRVRDELIPRVEAHFTAQQADLALLIPM
jgi:D-proline reductase (dithiol) PrdB